MPKSTRLRVEELHARINPVAGSLDDSFGTNGVVHQNPDGFSASEVESLIVQDDGKIVAVGRVNDAMGDHPAFFRYNADGLNLPTFDGHGVKSVNSK